MAESTKPAGLTTKLPERPSSGVSCVPAAALLACSATWPTSPWLKLKGALPLLSKVIVTGVVLLMPLAGLAAMVLLVVAESSMRLAPLLQVLGLMHCCAQSTLFGPVSAASQACVLLLVLTARRK